MRATRTEEGTPHHDITIWDSRTGGAVKFEEFVGPLAYAEDRARRLLRELGDGFEASIDTCKQTWLRLSEAKQDEHFKKD